MATTITDAEAEKKACLKMTSGRAKVIFHKSLYAPLLFRLALKAASWIKTMCTDGKSLMFNANFVLGLPMEHLMFCILHEVLHCVFQHVIRRGTRDPEIWNIACDLLINAILVFDEKLAHPEWICLDKKYWKKPEGSRWTVEEIYDDLMRDVNGARKRHKIGCPCVQRDPTVRSSGSGQEKDSSGEEKAQKGGGGAKGNSPGTENSKGKGSGAGGGEDEADGADGHDHINDPRGWTDVPWDKDTEETWKQAVIQTEQMARMRGMAPGWLTKLVEELVEPPIPIERILDFIAGSIASDENSWKNPNRRFISRGIHLPSNLKDRKDVVFIADTSGSIDDSEIEDFFGLMYRAFRSKGINTLRAIQCDQRITDDKVCKNRSDFAAHVRTTGGKGRGGTSFVPPFEKLRGEHADWKVACVIYLTDLGGDFPSFRPHFPVFWITIDRKKAPFGRTYFWDRKSGRVEVVRE